MRTIPVYRPAPLLVNAKEDVRPGGGGGAPPLWKVIGTCCWTGYDFAGHQYWHRVSNRPNVVITIGTGYQIGQMWSSPLTQDIKIGLRLSQDRVPIVFYDRPAIQAGARWPFFFACQLSIPNQTGYIVQYCNRVCIWMFLVSLGILWQGVFFMRQAQYDRVRFWPPPPSGTPLSSWEVEVPPPPPPGCAVLESDKLRASEKYHARLMAVSIFGSRLCVAHVKTACECIIFQMRWA